MGRLVGRINAFFQSVSGHLPPLTDDSPFLTMECDVPDMHVISVDETEHQLAHFSSRKWTGPDKIPYLGATRLRPLPGRSSLCNLQQLYLGKDMSPACGRPYARNSPPQEEATDRNRIRSKTCVHHSYH